MIPRMEKGPDMSRRKFLGGALAAGASLVSGEALAQARDPRIESQEFQRFRSMLERMSSLSDEFAKLSVSNSMTTEPAQLKDAVRAAEEKRIATASHLATGARDLLKRMQPYLQSTGRVPNSVLFDFRQYASELKGAATILVDDERNFKKTLLDTYLKERLRLSDETETILEKRGLLLRQKVRPYVDLNLIEAIKTL